ncbi:NACHT domain-containing protein [Luteolibacter luteus]|uniref:NACHT domain-containing protein n=1 Tax=Luteolibacter luteus TaxID=2728835 RepID=A0A858RFY2_9BACT|nr:NACHT domain-containing protein [Luteolibacter luteus]QJE95200.1 NACHT domain-containing protein [Luteolibacter luteus]
MTNSPDLIPLSQKEAALRELSEDDFRDQLIRPLFLRKGFVHGEEMCGNDEEGKDCYFTTVDKMGVEMIYAVQTKTGNLNMASDASKNLLNAVTQMKMVMNTSVVNTKTKVKSKPSVGILCASGKINQAARKYIAQEVKEVNLRFMDHHEIINDVDALYPEYWVGISAKRNPYLVALYEELDASKDELSLVNILADLELTSAVSEEGYANLRLCRTFIKHEKSHGKLTQKPDFEEISGVAILSRRKQLLLIKGDGGFGKSTLLRRLAEIESKRTVGGHGSLVPVIMRSTSIVADDASILEMAAATTSKINKSMRDAGFTQSDLNEGNVLLLIDALDEASSDSQKQLLSAKVAKFHADFPKCKIVLTTRPHSFIGRCPFLSSFEEWNVLPLEIKEAQKLLNIAAKNKVIPVEKTAEVLRQLNQIHGIEINPLLVTIMTATADAQRKDIPANITELFAKFCEIMLGRWDSKKGFSQQFEGPLKHRLLGDLALYMHSQGLTSIPEEECEGYLRQRLEKLTDSGEKIDVLLEELVHRSGLLRIGEKGIEFRHLLLQEYFAGCAIKDSMVILPYMGDEWWRRVIVFYFGSNPDDSDGLLSTAVDSKLVTAGEKFCAAVTVGLASQACYFVDIPDRVEVLHWVCQTLAGNLNESSSDAKYPLNEFLVNYLMGRDAVASEIIKHLLSKAENGCDQSEVYHFWVTVGLIEAGNLEAAFGSIKAKKVKDPRLLIALYMGSFATSKARITSKVTKGIADDICEYLEPYVAHHRKELLKEFRSILLEARGGKLVEAISEVDVEVEA